MLQLLVVDDEAHWVESLVETIPWDTVGIGQVFKAYSGKEALHVMSEQSIDVVITDIRMPEMSGLELIREIRKVWAKTKCIILSGYADFEYAQQAMQYQSFDYLLKPVCDEDLLRTVHQSVEVIRQEWEQVASYESSMQVFRENLPLLKSNLLDELLHVQTYSEERWLARSKHLNLPFAFGAPYMLMLARLEDGFERFKPDLAEFALGNIANELGKSHFHFWYTSDVHGYLVFVLTPKEPFGPEPVPGMDPLEARQQMAERTALRLQHNAKVFLKGEISLALGKWGRFPEQLSASYKEILSAFRQKVGGDKHFFLKIMEAAPELIDIQALTRLYEPPSLMHLLEAGRWEDAEVKLGDVFAELDQKPFQTQEHVMEVYFHLQSTFIYLCHKNNQPVLGVDSMLEAGPDNRIDSIERLRRWAFDILYTLRDSVIAEMKISRKSIIQKVQQFIDKHLTGDISLNTLARHAYMHPTHLSKIYKMETGEGVSQYIHRIRMEKAAFLLKNASDMRIYEVGEQIGIANTPYFIRIFKKYFGVTPQEYRES
ncbi:response regulator [Paenibacillus athensensis]|uniref:AraC family transcriptional regulator n=1 Tax=Paenibacillus athensensis TaxID=1967502 RepID=A0A4Y8PS96_9BACL|nr:response regulator [Paenibacillus athensensis]MCD1257249.1 response regulator [Paenibacillus athensensis]